MKSVGVPNEWIDLIDTMVPDILDLVLSTWLQMPAIPPSTHEDPITEAFCQRLRANRDSGRLPFRIDIQFVELDVSPGEDQGRLDITFSPAIPREDIYFCLECKRLNVPSATGLRRYATEYVTRGMIKFVTGQYSSNVRHGGMLGYVFDGDLPGAFSAIARAIRTHHKKLGMDPPGDMQPSSLRPFDSKCRETRHRRQIKEYFLLHHLMAPTSQAIANG
jgi:hypothetical protein